MAFMMALWIGNGTFLKSSSQWQLKEFSNDIEIENSSTINIDNVYILSLRTCVLR